MCYNKVAKQNSIVFPKGYVFLFSVKTHMPIFPYSFGKMNFVWRQLRLAFFGALTSVGALFVFY